MVSAKQICLCSTYCKSLGANDPRGVANLEPKGMIGRIYVGTTKGIKHNFLYIEICWAPREMFKSESERRWFQPLPRGPLDIHVSEKHV